MLPPEARPIEGPLDAVALKIEKLQQFMEFIITKEDRARDRKVLDQVSSRIKSAETTDKDAADLTRAFTSLRKEQIGAPAKIVDKLLEVLSRIEAEERQRNPISRNALVEDAMMREKTKQLREMARNLGENPDEVVP